MVFSIAGSNPLIFFFCFSHNKPYKTFTDGTLSFQALASSCLPGIIFLFAHVVFQPRMGLLWRGLFLLLLLHMLLNFERISCTVFADSNFQSEVNWGSNPEFTTYSTEACKLFSGPWTVATPRADQVRGMACKDGDEPEAIRAILNNAATGMGSSVVFPGTKMGADVVFAAKRADGRKLLVFVQAKASEDASAPEAMRSLTLPYHENRAKQASLPSKFAGAKSHLDALIADENTSVVFMVLKFGDAQHKAFGFEAYGENSKNILHVYACGERLQLLADIMYKSLSHVRDVTENRKKQPTRVNYFR